MGQPALAPEPIDRPPASGSADQTTGDIGGDGPDPSLEALLENPERSPARMRLVLAIRVLVSAGMLAFLIWKIEEEGVGDMIPEWTTASTLWLAGALGLTLAGIVLSALRWQVVLHALGQRPQLRRLLSLYLAGQFVANVLPTSIGGDVLRVTRLSRDSGQSHTSFASVVLERMTGWIVLPVITFIGLVANPGLFERGAAGEIAGVVAVVVLLLLGTVLFAVGRRDYEADFDEPKGWRRFLAAVSFGLHRLRHHPAEVLNVVAVGFAYQLVLVLAAFMGARALQLQSDVGITALLAFLPAVLIAQVLPVSISGLGIREGLLVVLLDPLGVPRGRAIALGLMLYFLNLVVSLLGAPSFAVGNRGRRTGHVAA